MPVRGCPGTCTRRSSFLCYTKVDLRQVTRVSFPCTNVEEGGAVEMTWTPEFFWRVFETTGSIWAYLLYRQLATRSSRVVPPDWVVPILN